MSTVNIHDAKTNLSRLIAEVEKGGEVVIARAGKPIARLVPVAPKPKRTFGSMKHLIGDIPDEAFAPMTDEEDLKEWGQL
ncbi:MAG: type II toxin-antitoxin system Phd/YefM family antitoxin [Paracoccaceae bacterium]